MRWNDSITGVVWKIFHILFPLRVAFHPQMLLYATPCTATHHQRGRVKDFPYSISCENWEGFKIFCTHTCHKFRMLPSGPCYLYVPPCLSAATHVYDFVWIIGNCNTTFEYHPQSPLSPSQLSTFQNGWSTQYYKHINLHKHIKHKHKQHINFHKHFRMAGLHLFLHKRRPEGHIMSTGWVWF